jgi:hypothetical protein
MVNPSDWLDRSPTLHWSSAGSPADLLVTGAPPTGAPRRARSRPRAELLHVLMLPDLERPDRIGEFSGNPKTRSFAELLIDCAEDRTLRAVLVGMLREGEGRQRAVARMEAQ